MKRKLLTLFLALTLVCTLIAPVGAQAADDRLTAVTVAVKETLGLDTAMYTEFYGELEENPLAPCWYLDWSREGGTLSVTATEAGKVLNYRLREDETAARDGGFAPAFPAGDRESARAAAQDFLSRVLTAGETYTMEVRDGDLLNATGYRFWGQVLVNGLPAGLSYSLTVRCDDNVITNFYRDDLTGSVMGEIPSPTPAVTEAQARAALRETLALRLEYVLPTGSTQAILRYLPETAGAYGDDYFVDAQTGETVNLTELARNIEAEAEEVGVTASGGAANDSAAATESVADSGLSRAEQTGAEQLADVLDRDALDAAVRAMDALGLDKYTLSTVSYAVPRADADDQTVTATLQYGRQVGGLSWRRTVTVDAKTGALLRVYSSGRMPETGAKRTVKLDKAQQLATDFLQSQCPEAFARIALYDSADAFRNDRLAAHGFTFAQQENGYFYTGNALTVGVDATDGSISAYEKTFDDGVTFESPDGILTADQALDAWLATYDAPLAYIRVPAAIDYSLPEYRVLLDYGIAYLYELKLGYALEREDYLLGIDAKTGDPAQPDWATEDTGIVYRDIAGHWAQSRIETLARYGVGYAGETFAPDQTLTQRDLIALLASTEGYRYDPADQTDTAAADELYEFACAIGLLTPEARDDDAVQSRADTVRLILDAMGYGEIARLQGIFRTGFSDDRAIPADLYGYAALAQGLGMIAGTDSGAFLPDANATRAQAAVMLYQLMAR